MEHLLNFDDPTLAENARRRLYPQYKIAAERVDDWKAKEDHAIKMRANAKGWLSRIFWQIKYLSAVGNGAEAERCRDGLFDPHWGCLEEADKARAEQQAIKDVILNYNRQVHGI